MADKPKTSGRSYAHKPYMNSTGYPASMARPGDKDYDAYRKRPHSDDKKPYMDDEYPEMEHYWTPYDPPNFIPPGIPDDPRIPPMNPNQPPDIEGGPDRPPGSAEFPGCLFGVPVGPVFVGSGETTFRGIGMDNPFKNDGTMDRYLPDPLVRLYVNFGPATLLTNYRTINECCVSMSPHCLVSAQVLSGFNKEDYHQLGEYCPVQVVGVTKSGGKCAWDFYATPCPPEEEFEWDYDNSAETIGDNDSAALYVTGGAPPFTWSIEAASGYSLAYQETEDRHNTLFSDEDQACGSAKITVIDGCNLSIQAGIRNSVRGHWEWKSADCGLGITDTDGGWAKAGLTYGDSNTYTGQAILGYQKQDQVLKAYYGGSFAVPYMETEAECDTHRSTHELGTLLIDSCLTWQSPLWFGSTSGNKWRVAGRKYASMCGQSQRLFDLGYNSWRYSPGYFNEEPTAMAYYEWEC